MRCSRAVFARKLRINVRTLEKWEQGRDKPNPQAAALVIRWSDWRRWRLAEAVPMKPRTRAQKWHQEKSKVKTRTLKTEGCGTPVCLTAEGLPPTIFLDEVTAGMRRGQVRG